jgi:hypothetical protein
MLWDNSRKGGYSTLIRKLVRKMAALEHLFCNYSWIAGHYPIRFNPISSLYRNFELAFHITCLRGQIIHSRR